MAGDVTLERANIEPGRQWTAGNYSLEFTRRGNLELHNMQSRVLVWESGTADVGVARMAMQDDGNLVIYGRFNRPVWDGGTWGHSGAYLKLQRDGNMAVYAADHRLIWQTATAGR